MAKFDLDSGFLLLYDWLPAIETLPPKELKILLLALINKQRNGVPFPEFQHKKTRVFAGIIEPTIDRRLAGQRAARAERSKDEKEDVDDFLRRLSPKF